MLKIIIMESLEEDKTQTNIYNMIKLITAHPIAINSLDHIHPLGTANDNTTNTNLIEEVEKYLSTTCSYLDLGCAGGQFVVDFHNRNHVAVGLEGSNYSLQNNRSNWVNHYNSLLFTCDITKPFTLLNKENQVQKFDAITAWEVLEHIYMGDLDTLFANINNHLSENGIFFGSIGTHACPWDGVDLHLTQLSEQEWLTDILSTYFEIMPYPFNEKVRKEVYEGVSFNFCCKKK